MSPASVVAGSSAFSLTVTGSNFTSNCVVLWNGSKLTTQVVSSTQAAASVPQSDIQTAGSVSISITDLSTNQTSNAVTFVVTSATPAPSGTPVAVTITPNSTSVLTGGTVQFNATVTGSSNTGITWSATGGSVNSSGLYTAPGTPGTYTVKATSVADNTKSASATVSVTAPATVSISISPTSLSLLTSATQQFTATVAGTSNTAVTWKASGGTLSSSGLYTAPAAAGNYTVTVTSAADTTKSASASVNVLAPIQHTATLSWTASTSSVAGYNVYRASVSGGPYTLINPALVAGTSFSDNTVASGTTYYYAVTDVDAAGVESAFSNQVTAVIPTP